MRAALPVFVLATLATACLGPRPWWEKDLDAWEGATVSEVMDAWGAPDGTVTDDKGRPTFVYRSTTLVDRRQEAMLDPNQALGKGIPDQGREPVQDLECSMYLEFENDVVVSTSYEGAGCQVVPRKAATDR